MIKKANFRNKESKGITLIALVVTIIVLIILAGISINLILGDNGIITKAKETKETYIKAEIKEKIQLALAEIQIEAFKEQVNLTLEDISKKDGKYNIKNKIETIEWEENVNCLGILDGYYFNIDEKFQVFIGDSVTDLNVSIINIEGNEIQENTYSSDVKIKLDANFKGGELIGIYYSLDNWNTYQEGNEINLKIKENEGQNVKKYKAKGKKEKLEIETKEKEIIINIDSEPPMIYDVKISNVKDISIDVSITAEDTNIGIKEYEYYAKKENEEEYILKLKSNQSINTILGLEPNTSYKIMCVAIDNNLNRSEQYEIENLVMTSDNLESWQRLLANASIDYNLYNNFSESMTTDNINKIVSSEEAMNYIGKLFSNESYFELIANNSVMMEAICENSNARLEMYNNYNITQGILASSSTAINAMKSSSRYEVISDSTHVLQKGMETRVLYNDKAFVIGISQMSWDSTNSNYQTIHGYYIDGSNHSVFGNGYINTQINETYGNSGLKKTVYKFASKVEQQPNYYNGGLTTTTQASYAAIFKI